MQKKVIVISFMIVVLIWIGYMVSRHLGKEREREAVNQDTYAKLLENAKKSPNSGLIHVGMRLNKYNDDKGVYPERLIDLYPEYLPSEDYIRDIQWDYQRTEDNNFSLKKTINKDGRQITTYVDKSLRIASVSSTTVAAIDSEEEEDSSLASDEELGVMVASPVTTSEDEEVKPSEETEMSDEETAVEGEEDSSQRIATAPEIVSIVKEEIAPGIDPKLANAYLVWKDEDGKLGFGNVDYPSSYRLSVYSNGTYQSIKKSAPLEVKSDFTKIVDKEKSKDEIASSIGKENLVWKNKDGTLGFGNVDYPKSDNVSHINVNGTWEEKK